MKPPVSVLAALVVVDIRPDCRFSAEGDKAPYDLARSTQVHSGADTGKYRFDRHYRTIRF